MKSIYLKMMMPMMMTTLFATVHASSSTQTDPVNPQRTTEENLFPKYDNRIKLGVSQFYGNSATLSYERLKVQSMYFGVEVAAYHHDRLGFISALGGYNFLLSPKDRMTPVAGLGYYKAKHFDYLYPIVGMLYEHAFTDTIRLGANLKANFSALVSGESKFYLGVPFTTQIGEKKKWELEVQPYTFHSKGWRVSHDSIGIQTSIGYRF